jgi:hypothetical protein
MPMPDYDTKITLFVSTSLGNSSSTLISSSSKMMFRRACLIAVGLLVAYQASPWSKNLIHSARSLLTAETKPVIYTYYDEFKQADEMLKIWKSKWEDAGWDPVVLTIETAKSHSAYEAVLQTLSKGSGVRALHWLSVANAGGGWYSDCDVFPLHDFTNDILPSGGKLTLWENIVPSLVSGSAAEYERGALLLAQNMQDDGQHSDILALVQLSRNNPFGTAFVKEGKVLAGKVALDSNMTSCFEGKIAVHFTSYQADEIPSIQKWLDLWGKGTCSDLRKPTKTSTTRSLKQNYASVMSTSIQNQLRKNPVMAQHAEKQGAFNSPKKTQGFATNSQQQRQTASNAVVVAPTEQAQVVPTRQLPSIPAAAIGVVRHDTQSYQGRAPANVEQVQEQEQGTHSGASMTREEQVRDLQEQEQGANFGTTTTEEQVRNLQMQLLEVQKQVDAIAKAESDRQDSQQQLNVDAINRVSVTPDEQTRLLRMRLFPEGKIEWNELMRAAAMDENLVHQLAKGQRRISDRKAKDRSVDQQNSEKEEQTQGQDHQGHK